VIQGEQRDDLVTKAGKRRRSCRSAPDQKVCAVSRAIERFGFTHDVFERSFGLLRGSWTAYSRVVPRLAHVLLRKDVGFRSQHSAVKILFPLDFTKQGLLNRSGIKASRAKGACHEPAEIMRERLPFPTHAYRWIPMPSRPK
jgi:hypothetical protein